MSTKNKESISSDINDHARDVYNMDDISMYDTKMIEAELKPSNILGKIKNS